MSKWSHFAAAVVCILLWAVSWPYATPGQLPDEWWRGPLCFTAVHGHALPAAMIAIALTGILYVGIALRSWIGAVLAAVALLLWYLPVFYLMIHDQA